MNLKLFNSTTIIIFAVFIVTLGIYIVWPFSSASNTPAFLGTTFGMSLPEVQKALKKNGIQLVDKETFKMLEPKLSKRFLFWDEGELFLAEDKIYEKEIKAWYIRQWGQALNCEFSNKS